MVLRVSTLLAGRNHHKDNGTFAIHGESQALPRRRLVRRRLVSGDGAHVSATFSRPQRGRTAKSQTEIHLVLVSPVFLKRR